MLDFLKIFFLFFMLSKSLFNGFFEITENFCIHSFFLFFFLIIIFINFKINEKIYNNKFDLDILYKFIILFFKTPNFLGNYIINIFKQIWQYLNYFKFRYVKNTIKLIYKRYFSSFFLVWRPLFKKTSYFGYYRSNRSKWIK